jgi:hypothetical protein
MPIKLICPATLPGNFLANVHQTTWTFFAAAMAKTMLKNVRDYAWQNSGKGEKSDWYRDSKKQMYKTITT